MALTSTEEYQEIKIVTRYNFVDMTQVMGVSSTTLHTLTLVLNSVPETRKLHFFILSLIKWVNKNLCAMSQDVAELDEENRLLFDSVLFAHAVPSACQAVVNKRKYRFESALCEEVSLQLVPEGDKAKQVKQAKDELDVAFEGRVPRVLLELIRRLKALKAYDRMGMFREGGDVGKRDACLEQIDNVGARRACES